MREDAVVEEAWRTVTSVDLWHEASWHALIHGFPDPTEHDVPLGLDSRISPDVICRCRTSADLAAALGINPSAVPKHPFALVPLLFPTSTALADVAAAYCRAGAVAITQELMRRALTLPFPSVWLTYVDCLRRGQAAEADQLHALRSAVGRVGSDPRSSRLWHQLLSRLLQTPLQADEATVHEVRRCVAALTATRDADLTGIGELLAEATSFLAQRGPAEYAASATAGIGWEALPDERQFPSPAGPPKNLWQQWLRALASLDTAPIHHQHATHHRLLMLEQLCCHCPRVETTWVLFVTSLVEHGATEQASDAASDAARHCPGPRHALHALLRIGGNAPHVAALATCRERTSTDPDASQAKQALRAVGKALVAEGVPYWEVYQAWGTAELNVLGDQKLLGNITKRSAAVAERACGHHTNAFAAANFAAVCRTIATWYSSRKEELECRNALEAAVQQLRFTPWNSQVDECWNSLVDAESTLRGFRMGDAVAKRQHTRELAALDSDARWPLARGLAEYGSASHIRLNLMRMSAAGLLSALTHREASELQDLADLEASTVSAHELMRFEAGASATLAMHTGRVSIVSPTAYPSSIEPRRPLIGPEGWRRVAAPPANPAPPLPSDDPDAAASPRSMRPPRKLTPDGAIAYRRVWQVQHAANAETELFAPGASLTASDYSLSDDSRLASQLQQLVDVCRGLPALAGTATDVSVAWLMAVLQEPLELRYDADMEKRKKAHRVEELRLGRRVF
jgi:hypothetical protein